MQVLKHKLVIIKIKDHLGFRKTQWPLPKGPYIFRLKHYTEHTAAIIIIRLTITTMLCEEVNREKPLSAQKAKAHRE